jgi:hypothetical protein
MPLPKLQRSKMGGTVVEDRFCYELLSRLLRAVVAFDERLRAGLTDRELTTSRVVLERLTDEHT